MKKPKISTSHFFNLLQSRLRVKRNLLRSSDGEQYCVQSLVREWTVFGLFSFCKALSSEKIPSHVYLSYCAFGDCGDWVSKFARIAPFDGAGNFRIA